MFPISKIFLYFGLSKLIGKNVENPQKRNVFGVLPHIAPEVLGEEEYTKSADVYWFSIIAYEIITGFQPYSDVPYGEELALKICNGLRPRIPFHTPKLITQNTGAIAIQIKEAEEFSKNQETADTTTTPLNYKTHPQAIYISRLLNFSNLPKPINESNFKKELKELTETFSHIITNK
ncbi:hypothetical protein Glove_276g47 [Diversispora epigaea]|uniref:Protein kinase domain-containing protein n=1 Tax=Diversispora epigaea TaxID=1348612 RepID=A0A397I6Q6_9GLOM|nr:hypothetical protein Glove_276g47 [Diversispora epigaea]